ncbi:MAG: tetratricopeptide repeat protein [bacterium]
MFKKLVGLCILGTVPIIAFAGEDIKGLYNSAVKYYTAGKYSDAIRCWQRILEIDPEQTPPLKMIKFIRQKIEDELNPKVRAFEEQIMAGRWFAASDTAKRIMDIDPTYPGVAEKKEKLEKISSLVKDSSGQDKVLQYVRKGIVAYLEKKPGLIFDALIYAGQINKDDRRREQITGILSYFESVYPEERSKIKLIEGMDLLHQLLQSSLDSIYKADYTGAIIACDRALALDENKELALMRRGSAYYALKNFSAAKKNWEDALKINPDNKDIKKFLKSLEKQERKRKKGGLR